MNFVVVLVVVAVVAVVAAAAAALALFICFGTIVIFSFFLPSIFHVLHHLLSAVIFSCVLFCSSHSPLSSHWNIHWNIQNHVIFDFTTWFFNLHPFVGKLMTLMCAATHKQTNKQINKQTNKQTRKQTNKQTNKRTPPLKFWMTLTQLRAISPWFRELTDWNQRVNPSTITVVLIAF